jgi:hypothetical protein
VTAPAIAHLASALGFELSLLGSAPLTRTLGLQLLTSCAELIAANRSPNQQLQSIHAKNHSAHRLWCSLCAAPKVCGAALQLWVVIQHT